MTRLSVVVPHWPLDADVDAALRTCLGSLPDDCEKLVIVNEGTGFARNVNIGLGLANGEFVAVVGNDSRVVAGDVYELCLPAAVTSPVVIGKPGIEPGGFHGAFWVAPREVIDRIGPLDEGFKGAFFEDDDYLERLRAAGVPTLQVTTVRVESRRIGLTMSKVPERAEEWYAANERRFAAKWGRVPPAFTVRYRRADGDDVWHFCQNCPGWPAVEYVEQVLSDAQEPECGECRSRYESGRCAF